MRFPFRLIAASLLLCCLPALAHAREFYGLEAMTSTVIQKNQSSLSGLAARARIRPPRLVPQLELLPTVEYWRNSTTISQYGIETMRKDATLGMDVRYNFNTHGWRPYLGMGYGIHFITTRVNAPTLGLVEASNSLTKGGLAALGGVSFGLSDRIDNFIELKYHDISDYRQLKINWGLS